MIAIEDVRGDLPPADRDRLTTIHLEAFPPAEQHYSMDYMLEQAAAADAVLRVIRSDGIVRGYVYFELAPESATAFLWYVAVDAESRGRGLGRAAMIDTLAMIRRDFPDLRYALFEVHKAPDDGTQSDHTVDRRRLEFYRRLGAYWVRGIDYRIPAADDPTRSVAYEPMFFALRDQFDRDEIRDAILLMAQDNFQHQPEDPRWLSLQAVRQLEIVAPPAA